MEPRIKQDYRKYYDILGILGYGTFGYVFKAKVKNTNEFRAIKVMEYEKITENLLLEYNSEEIKEQLKKYTETFIKEIII